MGGARSGVSRFLVVSLSLALLALALSAPLVAARNGGGNSTNAKLCQKDGWMSLQGSDGTLFASEEDCTSYAAKGGTLEPKILTFQSVCESYGGTYQTDPFYSDQYQEFLSPTCLWHGADNSIVTDAFFALNPYCPAPADGYWLPDPDPSYVGCRVSGT